ncbi:MAG: peptidoglycan-binding protein [Bryobacterales bacterium]|nr:peptidoglycan-binding protein [Bryobacterales bacterium]
MSKSHIVRQGECLSRIADRYGFSDWRTIYNHPANSALRKKRPNPNILFPGDEIVIPAARVKEEQIATGRLHRFTVKSPRKFLRVVFKDAKGEPFRDEPYAIQFSGGRAKRGATNGDGLVAEPVAMEEATATLTIAGRTLTLNLGHLNPNGDVEEDDLTGIQARLNNLGYTAGPNDGIYGRNTRAALALLQADEDLEPNGLPDEATLARLEKLHGC